MMRNGDNNPPYDKYWRNLMTMYEKYCALGLDGRWIGLPRPDGTEIETQCMEFAPITFSFVKPE